MVLPCPVYVYSAKWQWQVDVSLDHSTGCHNGDVGDLMVVNTSDIDSFIRFVDDTNVITSNATIGTSVY